MMLASGFAGLGYQVIWTEQCSLWLGHESAGVLAVLGAFFGGLALGGLSFGERIERSETPMRWYAGCELLIGVWSLSLLGTARPFSAWALGWIGIQPPGVWHWFVVFGTCFCLFLPATIAMGATLPAMERVTAAAGDESRSIARLYAANTLGAVLGVLSAAFWLIPALGLSRTALFCVALNLGCGALALVLFPNECEGGERVSMNARVDARAALGRLACTGFLGIGLEVLVVRVLSQVTEDTVFTFALLLAVYLVGTAAGAAAYQAWCPRSVEEDQLRDRLLAAQAAAGLASTALLYTADRIPAWVSEGFGDGLSGALAGEALLALMAFGPATFVMGALFSHLSREANALGVSFGRALGVNTLAAALAPAAFGVIALPALGAKNALLLVIAGYLGLSSWRSRHHWPLFTVAVALSIFWLIAPPLTFIATPEGGRVVSYREGVLGAVSVVEDASGVAVLRINNRQQEGSSATRRVDGRQAWLPLLIHPAPQKALFLGLGTGVTASAAAEDQTLSVDVVELLPEVIAASRRFTGDTPRLHPVAADARRYVRVSERKYDVIVADNFHPARSGSGALYTVEHFEAVGSRLRAGGVFCQWLPLHQLDLGTLRSIVRSFVSVYPRSFAVLANNSLETPVLGLVARREPQGLEVAAIRERLSLAMTRAPLADFGFDDEFSVLGSIVAGPAALVRFSAHAAANTDDRPLVMYAAPRITYAPDSQPRDRLIALLHELSVKSEDLLAPTAEPAFLARLVAYWRGRDRFIESGRDVHPSPRVEEMLTQVREPLLSVLRISPDFRPAYEPLLAMARALAATDAATARALLVELARLQPAREDARRMLSQLDEAAVEAPAVRH